jgi:adenosylcobinamide kinase/adenosylcobinamide-phosphate guanylyltransferase
MQAKSGKDACFTLVLGGAASGKSSYAQQLTEEYPGELLYVATAQGGDTEMAERILRHQQQRGERWQTLEEPCHLSRALPVAISGQGAVLIDCVTLWLTNLLLAEGEDPGKVWPEVDAFLETLGGLDVPVVLVSNELGLGLVPGSPLGRVFRDLAGQVNQRLAACADVVWFVAAGLPLRLK